MPVRSQRARALVVGAAVLVAAAVVVALVTTTTSGSSAPGSLHDGVTGFAVRPGSKAMVASLIDEYHHHYGFLGVTAGMPMITVPADQPRVPVAVAAGPQCHDFRVDTGEVPLPARAASLVGGSSDSPIVVWQPATDTDWELWQAHDAGGHWSACWGGRISDFRQSTGVFPYPFGLSASGISFLTTEVTFADVERGEIDHVMAVDVPDCSPPPSLPADRTDCSAGGGPISEGTRFRLPAGLRPPAGLTPFARMVFVALQRYGMVVIDRAGAVQLQAEDTADWAWTGHRGTDPITASWRGKPEYLTLSGIPWDRLQAVVPRS